MSISARPSMLGVHIPQFVPVPVQFAPTMTSNTTPPPYVVSASTEWDVNLAAWRAFDRLFDQTSARYYLNSGGGSCWVKLDLGAGNTKLMVSYAVQVNNIPQPQHAPKTWTMEGSNNNTAWDVLDTRPNEINWNTAREIRTYTCAVQTTAYRYFRINITANNGGAQTQIEELNFYGF